MVLGLLYRISGEKQVATAHYSRAGPLVRYPYGEQCCLSRQHHRTLGSDDRCRQFGGAGKVLVDRGSAGATFGDGPHDEALATSGVTAGENAVLGGGELVVTRHICLDRQGRPAAITNVVVSGCRKPTEMSTRSAGITRSVPGWRVNGPFSPGATFTTFRPVTCPFSSATKPSVAVEFSTFTLACSSSVALEVHRVVLYTYSARCVSKPSSMEEVSLYRRAKVGHGWLAGRSLVPAA